jgi:CDP-diacylglycerol--serine O-phosphatidyltransferase
MNGHGEPGLQNISGNQERKRRPRLARGMYILPSLFTAGNIALGFFSVTEAVQGLAGDVHHFDMAALAIGFAIPFDALDGRIARMTHTESEFGKELDSLADVITFGVAPSMLAWACCRKWWTHRCTCVGCSWARSQVLYF